MNACLPGSTQTGSGQERGKEIRAALVKTFLCQGCPSPEDLADETINRVIRKIPEIVHTFAGDPALYFSAVARFILLEYGSKRRDLPLLVDPVKDEEEDIEQEYESLDQCIQRLSAENRELILQYYKAERRAKIDNRKRLAERLGITLNALRVRADRIRGGLETCVGDCVARKSM